MKEMRRRGCPRLQQEPKGTWRTRDQNLPLLCLEGAGSTRTKQEGTKMRGGGGSRVVKESTRITAFIEHLLYADMCHAVLRVFIVPFKSHINYMR